MHGSDLPVHGRRYHRAAVEVKLVQGTRQSIYERVKRLRGAADVLAYVHAAGSNAR